MGDFVSFLWPYLVVLGSGFLRLLSIITKWPVMLLAVAIYFLKNYKDSVDWLIKNGIWRAETKAGTFGVTGRDQSSIESSSIGAPSPPSALEPVPTPSPAPDDSLSAFELTPEDFDSDFDSFTPQDGESHAAEVFGELKEKLKKLEAQNEQLEIEKNVANEVAWDFYFKWIDSQLVMRTKATLKYLIESPAMDISNFRSTLLQVFGEGEGSAVESALVNNGLINVVNTVVEANETAIRFMNWRRARGLEEPSVIWAYPPIDPGVTK